MKEGDLIYRKIFTKNNDDIDLNNNLIIKKNRVFIEKTSGRSQIWFNIIKKSKESPFFGYGSQADRWYINRSDPFYNNASSGFFYALICGGVLGGLIYVLIFYETLKLTFIFVKNKFFFKNNNLLTISCFFILITLLLRSLVENSFMIFSIDNIFFLTCYYILSKKIKRSL
jgi:O-antigen ligase